MQGANRQVWGRGPAGVLSSVKDEPGDFPGGAVDRNLPAKAGFDPWSRKIPRATEQLSLGTTTKEAFLLRAHRPQLLKPTCLETALHHKRSHHDEKPMHHNE